MLRRTRSGLHHEARKRCLVRSPSTAARGSGFNVLGLVAKMKRKPVPNPEPVIDRELLENAKRSIQTDQFPRVQKCTVGTAPCAPNSAEGLCWVCRRLKISEWRDSDQQAAQE